MASLRRRFRSSPLLCVVGVTGWVWVCAVGLMKGGGREVVIKGGGGEVVIKEGGGGRVREDGWRGKVRKEVVREESYLLRTWSDDQDPKIQRPLRNPAVLTASIMDDTGEDSWDPVHLRQMLDEPTATCRHLTSLGGHLWCGNCRTCLIDGNKYTCFDPDVRPVPGDCLVYSVGVGGEISWDVALAHFNCSVYALDMTLTDWRNGMLQEGLHFLDIGLAAFNSDDTINMTSADGKGANQKWEWKAAHFRTLEKLRDILGHNQRTIDVLKLDIEHWEWKVLASLLSSPSKARVLDDVKQIALEIHLDGFKNASAAERVEEGRQVEGVLSALHSRGFHLVHTELNTAQQVYAEVRGHVFPLYRESLFIRRP